MVKHFGWIQWLTFLILVCTLHLQLYWSFISSHATPPPPTHTYTLWLFSAIYFYPPFFAAANLYRMEFHWQLTTPQTSNNNNCKISILFLFTWMNAEISFDFISTLRGVCGSRSFFARVHFARFAVSPIYLNFFRHRQSVYFHFMTMSWIAPNNSHTSFRVWVCVCFTHHARPVCGIFPCSIEMSECITQKVKNQHQLLLNA